MEAEDGGQEDRQAHVAAQGGLTWLGRGSNDGTHVMEGLLAVGAGVHFYGCDLTPTTHTPPGRWPSLYKMFRTLCRTVRQYLPKKVASKTMKTTTTH